MKWSKNRLDAVLDAEFEPITVLDDGRTVSVQTIKLALAQIVRGYQDTASLAASMAVSRQTALRVLKALEQEGLIVETKRGYRVI